MAFELPTSLSPSKVSSFTDCALAFRFSAIDRLPEPPSLPATKGTLVHAALERLFSRPAPERTLPTALTSLDEAFEDLRVDPEYVDLGLTANDETSFLDDAEQLVRRYFEIEDPQAINPVGLELKLDVQLDTLHLRGIIDRLEIDEQGELVVTDYKTGRVPNESQERSRLGGVHFYAFLLEQILGKRPARVQLLYLSEPVMITTIPTEQSVRALERKVRAVWSAIERACTRENFKPKPSRLCDWCSFQALCPAFGGNPGDLGAHRLASATTDPIPEPVPVEVGSSGPLASTG
jgi:putative RecB family exonuclease